MPRLQTPANPFILMMDPQTVLAHIEHSERLERLHSRICRPLDKPQLRALGALPTDLAVHDRLIDDEPEDDE
jgi:hypothetical protein